jgi:hypothetical protein
LVNRVVEKKITIGKNGVPRRRKGIRVCRPPTQKSFSLTRRISFKIIQLFFSPISERKVRRRRGKDSIQYIRNSASTPDLPEDSGRADPHKYYALKVIKKSAVLKSQTDLRHLKMEQRIMSRVQVRERKTNPRKNGVGFSDRCFDFQNTLKNVNYLMSCCGLAEER